MEHLRNLKGFWDLLGGGTAGSGTFRDPGGGEPGPHGTPRPPQGPHGAPGAAQEISQEGPWGSSRGAWVPPRPSRGSPR